MNPTVGGSPWRLLSCSVVVVRQGFELCQVTLMVIGSVASGCTVTRCGWAGFGEGVSRKTAYGDKNNIFDIYACTYVPLGFALPPNMFYAPHAIPILINNSNLLP